MACPGGCVGGGGQPIYTETNDWNEQISHRVKRSRGLIELDRQREFRKSHENPMILNLYEQYLGKPGGPRAHELFHSGHLSRKMYAEEALLVHD
jgi:iron only hydrogenase large subunit-like protein